MWLRPEVQLESGHLDVTVGGIGRIGLGRKFLLPRSSAQLVRHPGTQHYVCSAVEMKNDPFAFVSCVLVWTWKPYPPDGCRPNTGISQRPAAQVLVRRLNDREAVLIPYQVRGTAWC
jgi:hypothetical protein